MIPSTRTDLVRTPEFVGATNKFPSSVRERLIAMHSREGFSGMLTAAEVEALTSDLRIDRDKLVVQLLAIAGCYARPPISQFRVGAVAVGGSGNLYYGANLEFPDQSLGFSVHAEQSAVTHAWMAGETLVTAIGTNAAPCGHCRQFLQETTGAAGMIVIQPSGTATLESYLVGAFGPRDLGVEEGLLAANNHPLELIEAGDALANEALRAAKMSYSPYSHTYAGAALRTSDGFVTAGAYAENAAFNPSMPPLQVALSRLNLHGYRFDSIVEAVLVSVGPSHDVVTRATLSSICEAPLRVLRARNSADGRES